MCIFQLISRRTSISETVRDRAKVAIDHSLLGRLISPIT